MLTSFFAFSRKGLYWLTDPDAKVETGLACERKPEGLLDLDRVCSWVNV